MFDSLVDLLSGSPWTYAVVLGCIAGSAVLPLLPSESMITTAGVLAGAGELSLALVILAGAVGSFAGDNAGYLVGRGVGAGAVRWVLRGERGARSLAWARRALERYGAAIVVVGRFVPGGQTAVAVGAGVLAYPWRRYASFAGLGALVWAVYGSLLGALGGHLFEGEVWKGTLLSLAVALGVGGVVELVRRLRRRG